MPVPSPAVAEENHYFLKATVQLSGRHAKKSEKKNSACSATGHRVCHVTNFPHLPPEIYQLPVQPMSHCLVDQGFIGPAGPLCSAVA